jgi:hypothetical protein
MLSAMNDVASFPVPQAKKEELMQKPGISTENINAEV